MKLMTFNIRNPWDTGPNAWEARLQLVAELIRQEDPLVIGTQEGEDWMLQQLVDALPQYDRVGIGREDGDLDGEQCAILFKHDSVKLGESGTFWLSETPEIPASMSWETACTRICTYAQLTTPDGAFWVFNSHLDHISEEARQRGTELILSRMPAGERVLLMGDFNCGEDSPAIGRACEKLVDTFRAVHPEATGVVTYTDFDPTLRDGDKIDYIFCSPSFEVQGAEIVRTAFDGRQPSDHFPVTATLGPR